MPEGRISPDDAVARSWRYWLVELFFWAFAFTALSMLSAFWTSDGQLTLFAIAVSCAVGLPAFTVVGWFVRVWAQSHVLKRLEREFEVSIDASTFNERAFAQKLVGGEFGRQYDQLRRERDAGIR